MAQPGQQPPDPTVAFLNDHDASEEAFFQSGAVDLAVSLVGQYLYLHDSKIVVRILETEAYPADDAVYTKKFRDGYRDIRAQFNLKGGKLLAWTPSHYEGDHGEFKDLYITAGPEEDAGLVHIRSCEPILGHDEIEERRKFPRSPGTLRKLLIGPMKVSQGLGTEWQSEPFLYRDGGVQLFYKRPNMGETVLRGKRVLSHTTYYECDGTASKYRFALNTPMKFKYSTKCGGLKEWEI